MRKKIINQEQSPDNESDTKWLDIEEIASVEVSSEDDSFPIESALLPGNDQGWRASVPGAQTIRISFDSPQDIRRIRLVFEEEELTRTQEYALNWSSDGGQTYYEIARQQWNFNPENASTEAETHWVVLMAATTIELIIKPDISDDDAIATLKELRLARN
jgi:hypothetical protein